MVPGRGRPPREGLGLEDNGRRGAVAPFPPQPPLVPCFASTAPRARDPPATHSPPAGYLLTLRAVMAEEMVREARAADMVMFGWEEEGEEKRGVRRKRRSSLHISFFFHDTGLSSSPPLTHTWRLPSPPAPSARPLAR